MKLDLAAARHRTIPDVLPAGGAPLHVLFCGINPGLYSAATGWHFARPGNRFWPALHLSGFTPRLLAPGEQEELARLGLGITNIAPRATAQAAELTDAELRDGAARLRALAGERSPRYVAVAGVTAYRTAFGRPRAAVGPQDEKLGAARLWVLPNPSGLNASWPLPRIAAAFGELRAAVGGNQLCEKSKRRPGQNSIYASSWPEVSRWGRRSEPRTSRSRTRPLFEASRHRLRNRVRSRLRPSNPRWQERWDIRHCCHDPRAARLNTCGPC